MPRPRLRRGSAAEGPCSGRRCPPAPVPSGPSGPAPRPPRGPEALRPGVAGALLRRDETRVSAPRGREEDVIRSSRAGRSSSGSSCGAVAGMAMGSLHSRQATFLPCMRSSRLYTLSQDGQTTRILMSVASGRKSGTKPKTVTAQVPGHGAGGKREREGYRDDGSGPSRAIQEPTSGCGPLRCFDPSCRERSEK